MTEQRQRKVRSRKSIQKGGAITVEHARQRIYEKKVKEQLLEEAREKRERTRMVNVERKMQLRAGIDARKAERTRKKDLHEFHKSNPDTEPPIGLHTEIIDPDVTQKKREEEEEADQLLAIEESGRWFENQRLESNQTIDATEGRWEVEALLAKSKVGNVIWYLVKWAGFRDEDNTWQKRDDISSDLINDFEAIRVQLLKKREQKGKIEYFAKWKGRPAGENSWEKEATISREGILEFEAK
ncbi:hypothetical protein VC83_01967 [Pseudogymnoascus destructans]|uniref:Chromo domain-containing protein n=1 Tax=Pseudogymnoascus destructans TaxID=655981 RepID=A0A177AIH9_9PEZI|nr:uncharacterized protein VC83_01967 [Pseudogymnoascus destructans]OAF61262.1 hypothetical protein VC83_01967 [Pseudogymnoascus destructans]